MKKVFLHAYCQQNLGDDMFILRMVRRYPKVRFYAIAKPEYRQALAAEPNLMLSEPVKGNRAMEQLTHRFGYRAFVKLGGSIFMEPKDWKPKGEFPAWQCKLLNGNKFIIGANFGPHYTDAFLRRAHSSLRYYRGLSFRDEASYGLFRDIPQACCAPELLFRFDYPEPVPGRGVGISVIAPERKLPEGLGAEEYYTAMANIADRFIALDQPVRLLGFCEAERDGEAIEKILARMEHAEQAQVCMYSGDIRWMLDRMNECESIIACRFHAMVIGFALKKKVLPVIYSLKQTNVLEDLGFGGGIWDLRASQVMPPEEAVAACTNAPIVAEVERLAEQSDDQFAHLDQRLR